MKKVYAELGLGNETFLSTEVEEGEDEYRIPKFSLPKKIKEVYIRIWIIKRVLIISIPQGFMIKKKGKNRFKLIFGIGGEGLRD